jgi:hypothetical protein
MKNFFLPFERKGKAIFASVMGKWWLCWDDLFFIKVLKKNFKSLFGQWSVNIVISLHIYLAWRKSIFGRIHICEKFEEFVLLFLWK